MTSQALNKFLSEFLITVHKKGHNEEYESNSLRTFLFEKNILWTLSYEKRPVRANSESASVKAKRSKTERHGQHALSEEDIQVLFEKDLLGSFTAEALLNTVWFNNIIHFGLLGRKEHREMC